MSSNFFFTWSFHITKHKCFQYDPSSYMGEHPSGPFLASTPVIYYFIFTKLFDSPSQIFRLVLFS